MPETIEKGDLYFFYRNKVEVERATDLDDVQRFYLITVPDAHQGTARVFTVGQKRLPKLDVKRPSGREWAMNVMTDRPHDVGKALAPIEYETKTRGKRRISEAFPVGEGRYALVEHDGHTELAYRLMKPEKPGPAQRALELRSEASYVISVRNPAVQVEGFPESKPEYPERLKKLFAEKRWIDVHDPELLDYESIQLVLMGARERLDEIDLEIDGTPRLFQTLGLDEKEWPTEALDEGRFARTADGLEARPPDSDPSKGGRRGGRRARAAPSAAGVAEALKGIDLPAGKDALLDYAEDREAGEEVLETLEQLPDRQFETMADVQKAVGEVR